VSTSFKMSVTNSVSAVECNSINITKAHRW
jgi:hypothetical protein